MLAELLREMPYGLSWVYRLWEASWQGALWAAVAWAVTRALPRLPSAVRSGLWWMVSLKFVVSLALLAPVPLPLLPAPAPEAAVERRAPEAVAVVPVTESAGHGVSVSPVAVPRLRPGALPRAGLALVCGLVLLLAAWGAGAASQVYKQLKSFTAVRRLRRNARTPHHPELEAAVRELSTQAGLRRAPGLLVSDEVTSPLALGLLRPVVVLPARAMELLSVDALRMALAHEVAHVKRGDLWLGWVPALAEAVLFFHPLARLAVREYALAREESCDAEALRLTGAEPGDYGQLLLTFGVTRAHGPSVAHGASPHLRVLHRRLRMLESLDVVSRPRMLLRGALSLLGLVALVPFQVVAREPAAPAQSAAPAAAAKPSAPAAVTVPVVAPAVLAAATPAAPKAPSAPAAPAAPKAPSAPAAPRAPAAPPAPPAPPSAAVSGTFSSNARDAYVFVTDDNTVMSGSSKDLRRAHVLSDGEDILYIRRGDKEYVVRDEATLKPLREAFQPDPKIAAEQSKLTAQQAELSEQQSALGVQQAKLGAEQAELAHQQAQLQTKQARAQATGSEAEVERAEKELEPQEEALSRKMEELSGRMEELGQKQEALGEKQEALGHQQEALGQKQEEAGHEIERKMDAVINEALRNGRAEPVKS